LLTTVSTLGRAESKPPGCDSGCRGLSPVRHPTGKEGFDYSTFFVLVGLAPLLQSLTYVMTSQHSMSPPCLHLCASILHLNTREELAEFLDGLELLQQGTTRWDAVTSDGILNVPSDEHFLDAMIAACDLQPEVSARSLSGRSGVAALIWKLPTCDLCHDGNARYDAEVVPGSAWGNMCDECYRLNSHRVLGIGVGQYLFTIAELTGPVRQVLDHISHVCWPDSEESSPI
jgi:hypothetical protein